MHRHIQKQFLWCNKASPDWSINASWAIALKSLFLWWETPFSVPLLIDWMNVKTVFYNNLITAVSEPALLAVKLIYFWYNPLTDSNQTRLISHMIFNFGPIAFMGVCDVMTDAQEHIYLYLFMKQYFRQAVSQSRVGIVFSFCTITSFRQ